MHHPGVRWLTIPLFLAGCALSPPANTTAGEKVLSEDRAIWDFHRVGRFDGGQDVFRSAAPLRDLIKVGTVTPESAEARSRARERMASLHGRGIHTIVSLENADSADKEDKAAWIALERAVAGEAGINYISCPLANSGTHSFEDMTHEQARETLDAVTARAMEAARTGGVLIHCSAGHDRTGIVVAYMRLRYEHWSADRAIEEMRFYGHNWPKFSGNFGVSSWHEEHIRVIAQRLAKPPHF